MEQAGVMDHAGYLAELAAHGKLMLGGPFLDDTGGMVLLAVESEEEALRIAAEDPGVISGLLRVEVRPWLPAVRSRS